MLKLLMESRAALLFLCAALLFSGGQNAAGQSPRNGTPLLTPGRSVADTAPAAPSTTREKTLRGTTVNVELLSADPAASVAAQKWFAVFQKFDVGLQVRRPVGEERLEVKERMVGKLRQVTVVAQLERDGRILVHQKKFAPGDTRRLEEWLNDLKTYGAQGRPDGEPLWGLNAEQFDEVFRSIASSVLESTLDETLESGLSRMKIGPRIPLAWSSAAEERRKGIANRRISVEVKGVSQGTALAIVLNEFGLSFYPHRTPGGQLELLIQPIEGGEPGWPVGWPITGNLPKAAPSLFRFQPIFAEETTVTNALREISETTKVPMYFDGHWVTTEKLTPEAVRWEFRLKQTFYLQVLKSLASKAKLRADLLQDEGGKPLVWLTGILAPRRDVTE